MTDLRTTIDCLDVVGSDLDGFIAVLDAKDRFSLFQVHQRHIQMGGRDQSISASFLKRTTF